MTAGDLIVVSGGYFAQVLDKRNNQNYIYNSVT